MAFGRYLKYKIVACGKTISEVATLSGISLSTITACIRRDGNSFDFNALESLANVFGMTAGDLINESLTAEREGYPEIPKIECNSISELGETLKANRIIRGFTQKQVADLIGVQCTVITRYETGVMLPSADKFFKLRELQLL